MRANSAIIVIILSFLLPFLLFLSYSLVGEFTLKSYTISNLVETYTIESNMLSMMGRNKLDPVVKKYQENISSLSYVESVDIKIKGTSILLSGKLVENGIIITDGSTWYFYSDSFLPISEKDVFFLKDEYIILSLPHSLFDIFPTSSFSDEEIRMLDTLKSVKPQSGLITRAEYDNNNSSVISGKLSLYLDGLNSKLVFEDIREIDRMNEALNIVEKEYNDSKEGLFRDNMEYVLSNGLLMKMR